MDVLVRSKNVCQKKEQLMRVAAGLRVTLNPDMVALHVVDVKGTQIVVGAEWVGARCGRCGTGGR